VGTWAHGTTMTMAHPRTDDMPRAAARQAGLRYTSDERPGISRRRRGRGFQYVGPDSSTITDARERARIAALAIPPAWTDVWICPHPNGHLQATGRDARGRKQYRYHPRWREVRDEAKYDRLIDFAAALPRIRRRVDRDLRSPALSKQRVVAAVVRLLDETGIRVGNDEYARENGSFGLTTVRKHHVDVGSTRIGFRFRGKGGKEVEVDVSDPRVARVLRRCEGLPGQHLFRYLDDEGKVVDVDSDDVNEYLHEVAGDEFTAKDFRTWNGTVLAARALGELDEAGSPTQAKRQVVRAVESVAGELGNTPAVCRNCYIHPDVIEAHLAGGLSSGLGTATPVRGLAAEEAAVLALLRGKPASGS
jgi:DNA topoisomerase I